MWFWHAALIHAKGSSSTHTDGLQIEGRREKYIYFATEHMSHISSLKHTSNAFMFGLAHPLPLSSSKDKGDWFEVLLAPLLASTAPLFQCLWRIWAEWGKCHSHTTLFPVSAALFPFAREAGAGSCYSGVPFLPVTAVPSPFCQGSWHRSLYVSRNVNKWQSLLWLVGGSNKTRVVPMPQ